MHTILKQSWHIYRQHFLVITAVVVAVCAPLELLRSYMDAFVFGKDNSQHSSLFAQLLSVIGIIATCGVIFIAYGGLTGQKPTFRDALSAGFRSLPRMFWTVIVWGTALSGAFLLLIIPGVYLLVRWSLVGPVAC